MCTEILIVGGIFSIVPASAAGMAYITNLADPIAAAVFSTSIQLVGLLTGRLTEISREDNFLVNYLKFISGLALPIILSIGVLFQLGYGISFAEVAPLVFVSLFSNALIIPIASYVASKIFLRELQSKSSES